MENTMPHQNYFYTESEWDRLGCGPIPEERKIVVDTNQNTETKNETETLKCDT